MERWFLATLSVAGLVLPSVSYGQVDQPGGVSAPTPPAHLVSINIAALPVCNQSQAGYVYMIVDGTSDMGFGASMPAVSSATQLLVMCTGSSWIVQ